ncbi:MAG: class B sortase [Lachnospiraceae bacterium]|nr:class B sortase [Lachnospiraceae bacterium]
MSSDWTVDGRTARNKSEYEAFLRDSSRIKKIRSRIDLKNKRQLEKLYSSICTGQIKFESKIGFDFEDEITELYNKAERKEERKNKNTRNTSRSREEKLIEEEDRFYSDYLNSHEKVDIYDKNVDKELVDYYLEKNRKKKGMIKFVIIAVSFGVLILSGFMAVIKIASDRRSDSVSKEIKEAAKDNAFVFTTIKQPEINNQATFDTYEIPDILMDYQDLYDKNNDLVGWIKIDDTHIDYPVLQSEDNEYYLTHNFNGKNDANGSIFVDMNCSIFPRSKNIILYGHHMKSGKMFANLEKYDSYEFLTNHKTFVFDTIYEHAVYEVVFVFRDYVHASDDTSFKYYEFVDVTSETEFNSYMEELKNKSIYTSNIELTMDDELLTLSTCDYMQENGRFVVMARKLK